MYYLCIGPMVWGTGETAAAARQQALRNREWGDPEGRRGEPVWTTYQADDRAAFLISGDCVNWTWPKDVAPPLAVEVRDGHGELLPLSSVLPMRVFGDKS